MKILIISTYFPPQNSIASLRPYSWAKYWSRFGHEVKVLTTPKHGHPMDAAYSFDGFEVCEIDIPPLNPFQALMKGKSDGIRASQREGHDANIAIAAKPASRKLVQWMRARYGILSTCRMPDHTDRWVMPAFNYVSDENWDLVVSTGGPYAVHNVAYRLKEKRMTSHWIADWRDLWVDNHIYPGLWPLTIVENICERRWMDRADFITTVSDPLAAVLKNKYGPKVYVICNGYDTDDNESLPLEKAYPQDDVLRIVYTGSVYPGRQDPSPLFRAIFRLHGENRISPEHLEVLFYGNNADMSLLAEKAGVSAYIRYGGFVPRQQALWFQRDADALLFLEFQSKHAQGILTGKVFEYLVAGPPILSIGNELDGSADELFDETGRGWVLKNHEDLIAGKIIELMEAKKNTGVSNRLRGQFQDNPIIARYSRKKQAEKLINLLPEFSHSRPGVSV